MVSPAGNNPRLTKWIPIMGAAWDCKHNLQRSFSQADDICWLIGDFYYIFALYPYDPQQPQIVLLKEGTDSSQGKPQLVSNINACQSIVDAVRTSGSPRHGQADCGCPRQGDDFQRWSHHHEAAGDHPPGGQDPGGHCQVTRRRGKWLAPLRRTWHC